MKTLTKEFPQRSLWGQTNEYMLKKSGKFQPFENARLIIPNNFIRVRVEDILDREKLCNKHLQVRLRTIFGSNLRADAIELLRTNLTSQHNNYSNIKGINPRLFFTGNTGIILA